MYECPECKYSRWRTLRKGKIYRCRNCGYTKGEVVEKIETPIIRETVPIIRGIPIRIKELNWYQKLWQKIKNLLKI